MASRNNVLEIIINGTNRAGPAFKKVGVQAMRMGAIVSGAFIAATVRAGKFEKGLAEISTLLDGDTTPAINRMRGELMDLSAEFGQSIGKMTKARYDVISAGFTGAADSAIVLEEAAKLAVAGVSDVASTADLLTTAINGLGLEAKDAGKVSDVLFQTVRKGKTTMDQLAQSMGPLFATAKTARVELDELGAVMATLTAKGINTAESVTALNQLMLALAAPSGEAKDELAEMGVTLDNGLIPALIALSGATDEGLAKLSKLIPNIRALKAAATAANDVGVLTDNLNSMRTAVGVVDSGVAKMSETFDFQLSRARASLDNLVIEIGSAFLPEATKMMDMFNLLIGGLRNGDTQIKALATTVGKWAVGITAAGAALSALAAVMTIIGPIIASLTVAFFALSGPIQLAIVGFGALAVAAAKYRVEIERKLFPLAKKFNDEMDKTPSKLDKALGGFRKLALFAAGLQMTPFNPVAGAKMIKLSTLSAPEMDNVFVSSLDKVDDLGDSVKDTLTDAFADVADNSMAALDGLMAKIKATVAEAARAQVKPEDIVFIPEPEQRKPEALGPAIPDNLQTPENRAQAEIDAAQAEADEKARINEESAAAYEEYLQNVKDQIASLAEFTLEDFAQMAFSIGDSFADVATSVGGHMLGLTKGPLMLGRAFKQMAMGILSDLARMISRMLVAKAIMASLSGGLLGGLFQTGGAVAATYATGGPVLTAATGRSAVGGAGYDFPPIVLPGSSGLDRRPILAAGGETIISRPQTNALQAAFKQPQTSPRRGTDGRRRRQSRVEIQAVRPFRRDEQILLADSVTEGLSKAERYGS